MTTTTTPSLKLYRDASSSYSFGGFAASQITAFVRTSTTKTNAEPTTVTVSYAFTYSTPGGAPITTTIDASNATPTKLDGQFEDTTLSGRPTPTTSTGFSSPNVIATGTATPQTGFNPSNSNEVNHTGAVKPSNSPSQVPTSSGSIAAAVSITVQGEPNAVGTYTCTPAVSGSSDSTCRLTSTPSNSGSDGALKVSVGVLAALFILALAGFLFLLFRRRNHRDTESHSAPFITPPSGPSHAIGSEKARITALEQQLQAAQTSLLATAVSKPAPIDDRTIASQFDGLAQEIKDWSLTHLRRNPGPHEFSPELREVLRARVPDYERLLTVPKTRGLVVRAAVSALLVDAFEDGYLFPGGSEVRAVEKGMRKNMSDSDFNSWRCSTYASIAASFGSERDLLPALEPLARRIDALVAPFADAPESRGRLKYLHRILYTFVTLSLTLLSQPAHFHILDPKPTPIFDCRTMDDVLQEHETKYSSTGRPENPLQGRQCSAVVFPGVEKWGNGQLGAEAEWESLIVVVKARVLV